MIALMEALYAAAEQAGFLKEAIWTPANGPPQQPVSVAFKAPDESILDGYQISANYYIRFPASCLVGLAAPDLIHVNGVTYRVREVRAIGDGSEREARLCLP